MSMYVPNRIKKGIKTEGKSWLWNLYINTARWRVMISDSERERKTGLFYSEIKRKKESTTNCFVESILQGFMSQFPKQRGFSCSIWSCDLDVGSH